MRPTTCASRPLALLAVTTAIALQLAPVQAQQTPRPQPPQQAHPGKEATGAVGSQVQPMKPDCPPQTATGEKQPQHPPTAGLSR